MDELGCDSENANIEPQVQYSTEDITDNEDREATAEHTETRERTM
jgi:hypothetical protein